jgi:hypothetical protein
MSAGAGEALVFTCFRVVATMRNDVGRFDLPSEGADDRSVSDEA